MHRNRPSENARRKAAEVRRQERDHCVAHLQATVDEFARQVEDGLIRRLELTHARIMKSADIPTSTYWRYLKTNAALRLSTRKLLTKSSGEANAAGAAEPNEETVEQEAHRLKSELARQISDRKRVEKGKRWSR